MRLPFQHRQRRNVEVAMTPMIDVVFLLLIFFICTASFQIAEEVLPASLSALGSSQSQTQIDLPPDLERVVVKVRMVDGSIRWIVNEQPYKTLAEVQDVLRAVAEIDPSLPVILDVGGNVPLGQVVDAYDVCRLAGFEKIQFAASVKV